jgi:hypothetical protein
MENSTDKEKFKSMDFHLDVLLDAEIVQISQIL